MREIIHSLFVLIYLCLMPGMAFGNIILADTIPIDYGSYEFIRAQDNQLVGAKNLDSFFVKLRALERGEVDAVSVVHIGDSHVQADFWTGQLRALFQERFGNRGRGLSFPFALAESHNPLDVQTTSNGSWQYKRNIFKSGPPMGIAGASIQTNNPEFYIDIVLGDSINPIKFNKITLFNQKGPASFDYTLGKGDVKKADSKKLPAKRRYHRVRSGETLSHLARRYGTSVSNLKRWNGLRTSRINIGQRLAVSRPVYIKPKTPDFTRFAYLANTEYPDSIYAATLFLDAPAYQLIIKGERQSEKQTSTVFHGVAFENTLEQGMLYHAIGVNGATFYHFSKAALFFDQLDLLEADLYIVSLGTNESSSSRFDITEFSKQMDEFLTRLKTVSPKTSIILTTNPAIDSHQKLHSANAEQAAGIIRQKAADFECALWDQKIIMGDSMPNWQKKGLARSDGIHFTREGYALLGELLYNAILKAYAAEH
jgi:LysM repeat protein/lysophospholipase L1-like esterase